MGLSLFWFTGSDTCPDQKETFQRASGRVKHSQKSPTQGPTSQKRSLVVKPHSSKTCKGYPQETPCPDTRPNQLPHCAAPTSLVQASKRDYLSQLHILSGLTLVKSWRRASGNGMPLSPFRNMAQVLFLGRACFSRLRNLIFYCVRGTPNT